MLLLLSEGYRMEIKFAFQPFDFFHGLFWSSWAAKLHTCILKLLFLCALFGMLGSYIMDGPVIFIHKFLSVHLYWKLIILRYFSILFWINFVDKRNSISSLEYFFGIFLKYLQVSWKLIAITLSGERTFGVLTKIDLMDKGTDAVDVSLYFLLLNTS